MKLDKGKSKYYSRGSKLNNSGFMSNNGISVSPWKTKDGDIRNFSGTYSKILGTEDTTHINPRILE